MWRTLIILFFCALFTQSFAQNYQFGHPSSKWVFDFFTWSTAGQHHFTRGVDSIIQDKKAYSLNRYTRRWQYVVGEPSQYSTSEINNFLWFSFDQGLLLLFDSTVQQFDTLINYHALPGDNWSFDWHDDWIFGSEGYVQYQVLDTGTALINSLPLYWLSVKVSSPDTNYGYYLDTLYNLIGGKGYFFPNDFFYRQLDGGFGGDRACYYDDSIGIVGSSHCEQILAVKEQFKTSITSLSLFPNPVQNYLSWSSINGQFSTDIFDVNGRKIHTSYTLTTLDISSLNSGFYLLQIKNSQGILLAQGKFMKL